MNTGRPSTVGVDVLLAVAVAGITVTAQLANLQGPDDKPLDALGWLLAPVLAGLLLVHRRHPAAVLTASSAALIGYYALGYPPVGLALPLAGAIYGAAEAGRLRWALGISGVVLIGSYGYRVGAGQNPGYLFGYELALTVVVWGGAIAVGDAIRSRRRARAQAAARAAWEAERREQQTRQAIEDERRELARDVHDTLAHTVAIISLHTDVALESLSDDPAMAERALTHVRTASREATRELRGSLAVLRGDTDPRTDRRPVATLHDLPGLVERARGSGLPVNLDSPGIPSLPATVDSTAYRIVQEALTNVLRHARATTVLVRVRHTPVDIELSICDDGKSCGPVTFGHGLTGMTERAALLGGSVTAQTRQPHGFLVTATLPLDPTAAPEATA